MISDEEADKKATELSPLVHDVARKLMNELFDKSKEAIPYQVAAIMGAIHLMTEMALLAAQQSAEMTYTEALELHISNLRRSAKSIEKRMKEARETYGH